jgi:hypothetical protein
MRRRDKSELSFIPPYSGMGMTTEEIEPLHKFSDCMASQSRSEEDKQLAVWAVKEGWLRKSRSEALQVITEGLVRRMSKERHDQLQKKKPEVMRMEPSLAEESIDSLIEEEYQKGMPAIHDIAATRANEQLNRFLAHDKVMLSSCGYAAADNTIFQ